MSNLVYSNLFLFRDKNIPAEVDQFEFEVVDDFYVIFAPSDIEATKVKLFYFIQFDLAV